jgi:hypothetical protein
MCFALPCTQCTQCSYVMLCAASSVLAMQRPTGSRHLSDIGYIGNIGNLGNLIPGDEACPMVLLLCTGNLQITC